MIFFSYKFTDIAYNSCEVIYWYIISNLLIHIITSDFWNLKFVIRCHIIALIYYMEKKLFLFHNFGFAVKLVPEVCVTCSVNLAKGESGHLLGSCIICQIDTYEVEITFLGCVYTILGFFGTNHFFIYLFSIMLTNWDFAGKEKVMMDLKWNIIVLHYVYELCQIYFNYLYELCQISFYFFLWSTSNWFLSHMIHSLWCRIYLRYDIWTYCTNSYPLLLLLLCRL